MNSQTDLSDVRVVLTTAPDLESASQLVEKLVEGRHAACGNILPSVTSVFWWEGKVQSQSEVLIVFKTSSGAEAELLRKAKELHPYDVPELLVLPVVGGDSTYLRWVVGETAPRDVL